MECKNCGKTARENYCSHCGQRTDVEKVSVPSLLQELSHSVFKFDRGFFYTLVALSRNPGKSIREYLNGRRKTYFKPITYVLTLSTLYFLVSQLIGENTWLDDLLSGFSSGAYESDRGEDVPAVLIWFAKNFAYANLLLLPLFSLASYLAFSGLGRNYLEHIVLNSYITGQQSIVYTIFALLNAFFENELLESLPIFVAAIYTLWVFWQFFRSGHRLVNLLRSLLTYVLYLVFSTVLLIGIMFFTNGFS